MPRLLSLRFAWPLAAASLVYLALRAALLLTNFDAHCHPPYELALAGNIGHAAQGGWKGLDLQDYYDNCGGHLACGLLAAPLFALLGESYLVLKLVPIGFGLATLVLTWLVLAPRSGRMSAVLVVFLFALGPPTLARLALFALGSHFEALAWIALLYWIWLRWHETELGQTRATVLGVCAGLAVSFYFGVLLWLAVLAMSHVAIRGWRRSLGDGLRCVPGAFAGCAPLVWTAIVSGGRPQGFAAANLGSLLRPDWLLASQRAGVLVRDVLPHSGGFPDLGGVPGEWGQYSFHAAVALSAGCLLIGFWMRGPKRETKAASGAQPASVAAGTNLTRFQRLYCLPLLLYFPTFVLVFACSQFRFDLRARPYDPVTLRYLGSQLYVFLLVLGVAYGQLARTMRPKLAGSLAALALLGTPFTLGFVGPSLSLEALHHQGWSGHMLSRVMFRRCMRTSAQGPGRWNAPLAERILASLPERERLDVHEGLGFHFWWHLQASSPGRIAEVVAMIPKEAQIEIARGYGSGLRTNLAWTPEGQQAWDAKLAFLDNLPANLARQVASGMALAFEYPLTTNVRQGLELDARFEAHVPRRWRAAWTYGRGLAYARLLVRGLPAQVHGLGGASLRRGGWRSVLLWLGVAEGLAQASLDASLQDALSSHGSDPRRVERQGR